MELNAWDLVWLVVMLALSALFSGIEMAFVSTNRLKIELKSAQGDPVGQQLSFFVKKTPRVITTILVGNNLALVLYGIFIAKVLNYLLITLDVLDPATSPFTALTIQTIVSTLVILFFGEYLPKAFFRLKAEQIMFSKITPSVLRFFYYLFGPFVLAINRLSRFLLLRVFRLKYEEEELVFGKEDLNLYVRETVAAINQDSEGIEIDREMFENAMEFNETKVREFMVPRTELHALQMDCTIDQLIDEFIDTGHSKILIYQENLDMVIGFVHSSSLFQQPKEIGEVLQPIMTVPETMSADVLWTEFTNNRKTIALVVDEFGGTAGLVTIEDLVEEVFGEIEDEYDEPEEEELLAKRIDENTWLLSARHEVDDLNEEYHLGLPEGDYTTLGGLVIALAEDIPDTKAVIEGEGFRFLVVDASDNKIITLQVEKLHHS